MKRCGKRNPIKATSKPESTSNLIVYHHLSWELPLWLKANRMCWQLYTLYKSDGGEKRKHTVGLNRTAENKPKAAL